MSILIYIVYDTAKLHVKQKSGANDEADGAKCTPCFS
jgi:hypothetical protein